MRRNFASDVDLQIEAIMQIRDLLRTMLERAGHEAGSPQCEKCSRVKNMRCLKTLTPMKG